MPAQNISLVAASGVINKTINKLILLDLKFGSIEIATVFLIVKNFNVNILVGCDFLKDNDVILNFKQETVEIKSFRVNFNKRFTIRYTQVFHLVIDDENLEKETLWDERMKSVRENLSQENSILVNELIVVFEANKYLFSDVPGAAKFYTCKLSMKEGA